MKSNALAILILLAELVYGHGFVYRVIVDSQTYIGNIPGSDDPTPSVIRQISTQDPVMNATNPYLNCGQAALLAEDVADANPGSTLSFDWREANLAAVRILHVFRCCFLYIYSGHIIQVRCWHTWLLVVQRLVLNTILLPPNGSRSSK